jgi:hypothetical protein
MHAAAASVIGGELHCDSHRMTCYNSIEHNPAMALLWAPNGGECTIHVVLAMSSSSSFVSYVSCQFAALLKLPVHPPHGCDLLHRLQD